MVSSAEAVLPFEELPTDYHAVDKTGMWYGRTFTQLADAQQYIADMNRLYPDNPLTLKDGYGNDVATV